MDSVIVLRWTARLLSFFSLGLLGVIAVGEGMLDPQGALLGTGSMSRLLMLGSLAMAVVGLLSAWVWEAQGGAVALGGVIAFYAIGRSGLATLPSGWFVPMLGVPALLFFIAGLVDSMRPQQPSRIP